MFPYGIKCSDTVVHCRKLILYPGILEAAGGSLKKKLGPPKGIFAFPPDCRKTVATMSVSCFHYKINRHDMF